MKNTIFYLLTFCSIFIFSCEKGTEKDDLKKDENWEDKWEEDKKDKTCFTLIYPITYLMPDDTEITGNSEEEIKAAINTWYEENPNSEENPSLTYPVEITYEGGETKTVEDEEEMIELKKECEDWEKENCFEWVFPISMLMPDESVISGNNEEELDEAINAWYEANPNATAEPELQFPVDILFEDETVQTIENEEALKEAYEGCKEEGN